MFVRVFCDPGALEETVRFYEALTSTALEMDMDIPEAGLHVVAVGPFLILELDREEHGLAADTAVTVVNAHLDEAVARSVASGAEIVQPRWDAPVGAEPASGTPTACSLSTSSIAQALTTSAPPGPPFT